MAEDTGLERTEPASERRREQAREEGQVARSRELSTSLMLLAAGLLFYTSGPRFVDGFARLMRQGLSLSNAEAFDSARMLTRLANLAAEGLSAAAPLLIVLVTVALLAPTLVGGWIFSVQAMEPDFSRLSPMRGLKQMFSSHGFGELAKSIGKAALVGLTSLAILWNVKGEIFGLSAIASEHGLHAVGALLAWAFLILGSSMALIAAADVPFQIWRHGKGMEMTREEVRREMRESDGDPQMKARIRKEQRERARARMMQEVPKADVIVTNPLHYAVALRYNDSSMRAPTVVAKGAELVAARIRDLGAEHAVPILQAPRLARALYFHAEVGQEIPAQLYNAVAQVLAYVYQLRHWRSAGESAAGGRPPVLPHELPVPEEMDPQSDKSKR
jgi:flagellar biosynthesis protein FlhB